MEQIENFSQIMKKLYLLHTIVLSDQLTRFINHISGICKPDGLTSFQSPYAIQALF